ncbi:MAG TPA: phenylalanine--tRNA ligase subunit beta, partial [Candidatus Dojkabacteria bacterium]|nr:phenylalanine--tRNA ligase subunit beta [Candidatus Dojkabacteria bacterium]
MKLSLSALSRFVDISSIPFDKFLTTFSDSIAEVESVMDYGKLYHGIYVGEIREKKKHPNSEKLFVCKVNIGNNTVQVCAGAGNIEVGDKIAYIAPGNQTPVNPYPGKPHVTIEKIKMGGEESNGMMLSEKELGIGDDHSQILILPKEFIPGQKIVDVLDLNDIVIEIENKSLTHRPDCFGIWGLSREVSAVFNLKLELPNELDQIVNKRIEVKESTNILPLNVTVRNPSNQAFVQRYMLTGLSDIKVEKSPLWLKIFLLKHDVASINNVVDITNYVMILTGQPLHAFDYDKTTGNIIVRTGKIGEKILTLDDKVHELDQEVVVITDEKNTLGIGGVIGGKDSSINDQTTNILLETATFDMYNIRRTSMKLGLFTDAVTRYGKGIDPELAVIGHNFCIEMLEKYAQAQLATNTYDYYPTPRKSFNISLPYSYLYKRSGLKSNELQEKQIYTILKNLELNPIERDGKVEITIPTFRWDLKAKEDILEEIVRIYGYNNIRPTLPIGPYYPPEQIEDKKIKDIIRHVLRETGGNEVITYSFVGSKLYEKSNLNLDNSSKLINPLSPDLQYMRTTLIPSIIEKTQLNLGYPHNQSAFMLFEIGHTHIKGILNSEKLPYEFKKLSVVYTDPETKSKDSPYYSIKEQLVNIMNAMSINESQYVFTIFSNYKNKLPEWVSSISPAFHPNESAIVELIDSNAQN